MIMLQFTCNISGEIEKFWLISIKVGARADKLIPNPPEAEAVSPQIILTDIASEIIGLAEIFIILVWIAVKIGNALIILPYPTIALELSKGKKAFYSFIKRGI